MLVESWLSDSWGIDGELSKGRSKILIEILIKNINWNLTVNAFSALDPWQSATEYIIYHTPAGLRQPGNHQATTSLHKAASQQSWRLRSRGQSKNKGRVPGEQRPSHCSYPQPTPPFFGILMGPLRTDDDLLKNSVMCPFPNGLTSNITFSTQIHGCRKVLWILRRQFPAKFQLEIEHWILLTLAHTES